MNTSECTRRIGALALPLVIGPGPLDRSVAPAPERFEPSFANEVFRVSVRRPR